MQINNWRLSPGRAKLQIDRLFSSKGYNKIEKVARSIQGDKSRKDMASSVKLVSSIGAYASPKKGGRNHVSGRISVPCWRATPVANDPWKLLVIRWRSSPVSRSWILVDSLIGREVTVSGRGSEFYLIFVRGRHHIAEEDARIHTVKSTVRRSFVYEYLYGCLWRS